MDDAEQSLIGSGGVRLSGGQGKRLALARTLCHPRPVLILDDPFSALDRSTEDMVFANLQAYAKDKIVFLISHRLYHFPELRQVIFMENGKVAAEGTVAVSPQKWHSGEFEKDFAPSGRKKCPPFGGQNHSSVICL